MVLFLHATTISTTNRLSPQFFLDQQGKFASRLAGEDSFGSTPSDFIWFHLISNDF